MKFMEQTVRTELESPDRRQVIRESAPLGVQPSGHLVQSRIIAAVPGPVQVCEGC